MEDFGETRRAELSMSPATTAHTTMAQDLVNCNKLTSTPLDKVVGRRHPVAVCFSSSSQSCRRRRRRAAPLDEHLILSTSCFSSCLAPTTTRSFARRSMSPLLFLLLLLALFISPLYALSSQPNSLIDENVSLKTIDGQIKTLESLMESTTTTTTAAAAPSAHDNSEQEQHSQGESDGANKQQHSLIGNACTAPEVLVNGSPSPDIAGTVSGGDFASIEEIQFVGIVNTGEPADGTGGGGGVVKQKRICKIKCLNGVWIGPLCALQNSDNFESVLRPCKVPRIQNASMIHLAKRQGDETSEEAEEEEGKYSRNTLPWEHIKSSPNVPVKAGAQLAHGATIYVHCNEVGLFKLNGQHELNCVDGLWDKTVPTCLPTTIHRNFSVSSPPTILYTPIDGTLGVDERGRVVVSPGAMIHLDCLLPANSGQPHWNVTSLNAAGTPDNNNGNTDAADDDLIDRSQHSHHHHHDPTHSKRSTTTNNNVHANSFKHAHKSSPRHEAEFGKESPRRREVRMETFRTVGAPNFEELLVDGESSLRDRHRTGWAVLSDSLGWKYRLAIYYASHKDTGRYVCNTPNGQDNAIDIVVKDVKCPTIIATADSKRLMSVEGNRMHDRVRFSCLAGYELIGQFEIRCMPNGHWSHSLPTCKQISCPEIYGQEMDSRLRYIMPDPSEQSDPDSLHRFTGPGNHFGSVVKFSCPTGYRVVGESTITCTHKSQWSHPFPTCEQVTCPEPIEIEHGQLMNKISRYMIGDYVQYVCNTSHRMVNEPIVRCLENGTWSSPQPKCKPACTYPGNIAHGYIEPIKFYYDFGELVRVKCEQGYHLHHAYHHQQRQQQQQQQQQQIESMSGHLICDREGKWNRPTPECRLAAGA